MSGEPILEELRPRAFAVAYRMLGSVSEAEDVVQEALLRVHLTLQQGERIRSPGAYLSTVVTRLCIDQLRSARVRRESYVGEWLPEPLVADATDDPWIRPRWPIRFRSRSSSAREPVPRGARGALAAGRVRLQLREIASIVGKSEDNARQLAARARRRWRSAGLASNRPGSSATSSRAAS